MRQVAGPSFPLWESRGYESHFSNYVDEEDRPFLHLTPLVGWMNDPNGFSYYEGRYHLFYQYNPYDTKWGPMHWGHAVTDDFIHWDYLPAAIAPDMPYDNGGGCFSGSALTLPDGKHLLMYTGVAAGGRGVDGKPVDRQVQCLAVGDDHDYQKYEGNPVIDESLLPEGCMSEHFRDPKIWQESDGTYRCVVANLAGDKLGQILLFSSEDAFHWKSEGVLAKNDGTYGVMWECPDYFELDGKQLLMLSPQDMLPMRHDFHGGNNVICFIGHVDESTGAFVQEGCQTVDHGIDFYATQTLLTPDGRRIMVAWMQNWDTVSSVGPEDRIFGQMIIPREISVVDGKLYQKPVRELDNRRRNRVAYEGVSLSDALTSLDGISGRCIDLSVTVRSADKDNPYREFALWFAQDETFHTSLRYRPAEGELKINRTRSGSRRALLHHRKCIVGEGRDELRFRLILDRKCAEFFFNDGEQTMSITIPTDQAADGISFFAEGSVLLDVEKFDLAATTQKQQSA